MGLVPKQLLPNHPTPKRNPTALAGLKVLLLPCFCIFRNMPRKLSCRKDGFLLHSPRYLCGLGFGSDQALTFT